MQVAFKGKWRGTVSGRNAGFSQRVVVSGAASGNGTYNGVVGTSFVFDGGQVELQWNDNAGSGWQPSAVLSSVGMTSPLVVVSWISADDNTPDKADGDYDDLVVSFEHLDAPFEVVQRPFALERGSLVMMPDGIFDTSQGVQYMGVRIRNTWFFDWQSAFPPTGMKIGIDPASRAGLAAQGVVVLDAWTAQEQQAFGQVMDAGYVQVPDLKVGEETVVYFKVDVGNAAASKPDVGFVAQRSAFDPNFDAPSRIVRKTVFISRSFYDKTTREVVAQVPEGTLRLRLNAIKLDLDGANAAAKALKACLEKHGGDGPRDGHEGSDWWENGPRGRQDCDKETAALLRRLLRDLLAGKDVDLCRMRAMLLACCDDDAHDCDCSRPGHGDGGHGDGYPGGGWQDGTGMDGWCRVKPVAWLPVSFEYKLEPNPAYTGQFGPLAFEDPWWKVVLIIIAVLLAIASLVYDYVKAGEDPRFIIGRILRNGDAMTNLMDCAVCDLNGSRAFDLGALDAQGNDRNNGLPIEGLGNIIALDRTDNGRFGVADATLGNVVWKSGARSGTTRGVVDTLSFATDVDYDHEDTISGTVSYTGQVRVTQIAGMEQPLSQGGDSGSVWVDMATKRPVALNFAGDVDDLGTEGIGNPIIDVVDQLDIRFNT